MLGSGPVQNFGSTWPRGLDLPEPVIRKIAADNFRAFAGQAPKPLCSQNKGKRTHFRVPSLLYY